MSGNNIVWKGEGNNTYNLYLYDGINTIELTNNIYYSDELGVQLDGNNVIWRKYDGHDYEIYWYDGIRTTQLTNNEIEDYSPQIDSNNIAWYDSDNNVYLATLL